MSGRLHWTPTRPLPPTPQPTAGPWPATAPRWLKIAALDIGLKEIPGREHAPKIIQWLTQLGAWWRDDETPWCGVAMAAWMREAGVPLPKHWYRAKAWADGWGVPLAEPAAGCVVVFDRAGGGHVGLVVGVADNGDLQVLGGNQGNAVSVRSFPASRVPRFVWPPGEPMPELEPLAWAGAPAQASEGEA